MTVPDVPHEVLLASQIFGNLMVRTPRSMTTRAPQSMATLWLQGSRRPSLAAIRDSLAAIGYAMDNFDELLRASTPPERKHWRDVHTRLVLVARAWFYSDFDPRLIPLLAIARRFLSFRLVSGSLPEYIEAARVAALADVSPDFFEATVGRLSPAEIVKHWEAGSPEEYLLLDMEGRTL